MTRNENYLSSHKPNNIILLKDKNLVLIEKILTTNNDSQDVPITSEIYILGRQILNIGTLFDYPTPSSDTGIFLGENFSESSEIYSVELIKNKCILFDCDERMCGVSLLHE